MKKNKKSRKQYSFRTVRNVGLIILLLVVSFNSAISFYVLSYSNKKIEGIIKVEELMLKRWMNLAEVINFSKDYIYNYRLGKVEVIAPVVMLVNNALKEIDEIYKISDDPDVLKNIVILSRELKYLRQATLSYQSELTEGGRGASVNELQDIAMETADKISGITWQIINEISYRTHLDNYEVLNLMKKYNRLSVTALILLFFLTIIVAFIMGRALALPIRELVHATLRIAQGDLSYKVPVNSDDEIGQLASSFNKMTEDLRRVTVSRDELMFEVEQRKLAERELRENEQKNRLIIETANDAFVGMDADGKIIDWNNKAVEVFGWNRSEVIGQLMVDVIIPEAYREQHTKGLNRHLETGQTRMMNQRVELKALHRHGHEFPIEITIWKTGSEDVKFYAFIHDITERKKYEDQLRKFSRIIEQSPSSIIITDATGQIEYVNPKFTQVTGYTLEEVLGENPRLLKSGQTSTYTYQDLWETIFSGLEWHGELLNKKKNGELFWEVASISPVRNDQGDITHFLAIKEDITEHKQIEMQLKEVNQELAVNEKELRDMLGNLSKAHEELKETQSQLIHSEKMASIGQLAAGVAHEIKNPLGIILLGLDSLEMQMTDDRDQNTKETLEMLRQSTVRANNVVVQLLNFSRYSKVQFQEVKIHNVIDRSIELALSVSKSKTVSIERKYCSEDITLSGDPVLLEQVFFNLITNAIHAIEDTGEVVVRTLLVGVDNARQLNIEVIDNGPGIPQELLKKIMQPFFTTKEKGKGTGLGLSTAQMILEKHQGSIEVSCPEGEGTKFLIALPIIHL